MLQQMRASAPSWHKGWPQCALQLLLLVWQQLLLELLLELLLLQALLLLALLLLALLPCCLQRRPAHPLP